MTNTKAFTLIELVIVITILAILASVAIPSFQNMQKHARNAALRGALATVREAIMMYRAGEIVAGRIPPQSLVASLEPALGYPARCQVGDVEDNNTYEPPCTPKIMENGKFPENPWAKSWSHAPDIDPNAVGRRGGSTTDNGGARSYTNIDWNRGWLYTPQTGDFWANSDVNGEYQW